MMTAPRTTPAVLERIARELPEHPAVVTTAGGAANPALARTLTFAELRAEVRQAAAAMIDVEIRRQRPAAEAAPRGGEKRRDAALATRKAAPHRPTQ